MNIHVNDKEDPSSCQTGWSFEKEHSRVKTPSGLCLTRVEMPREGITAEPCDDSSAQHFELTESGQLRHSGWGPVGSCVFPETFAMPWGKSTEKVDILNTHVEYGPAVHIESCHWYYENFITYHPYNWTLTSDARLIFQTENLCMEEHKEAPMAMDTQQIWAKPLPMEEHYCAEHNVFGYCKHNTAPPLAMVALNMGSKRGFYAMKLSHLFAEVGQNIFLRLNV